MKRKFGFLAFFLGASLAAPVFAQSADTGGMTDTEVADISALIDSSTDAFSALATMRAQVTQGDVSGGATTLERALIADPENAAVRTQYVALLCLLDDRQAADYELTKLAGAEIADSDWADLENACGATQRPAAMTGGQ
jgi:predicted Zn-dependent protease